MFTFAELVDLILLNVNGGRFSSEAAVQRPDVETYAPIACHAVIKKSVFEMRSMSRAEGESPVLEGAYYQTYILDIETDTDRNAKYVTLPGILQSLPAKHTLEGVFPPQAPQSRYTILDGPASIIGYMTDLTQCWHEVHDDVSRIYFYGNPEDICKVAVRAAMQISPMLGETTLPMPSGLVYEAIVACIEHFRGQRTNPADVILDNKDVNGQPQ